MLIEFSEQGARSFLQWDDKATNSKKVVLRLLKPRPNPPIDSIFIRFQFKGNMSTITPATWANLGYGRLVHTEPAITNGVKAALEKTGFYEFKEDNTGIWAKLRPSVRERGVFVHSGTITVENMNDPNVFSKINDYWWNLEKIQPQLLSSDAEWHKKGIEEARGYKKILWMKSLLFRANYTDYIKLFRDIVTPAFLKAYPKGQIHIIRFDQGLGDLLQAIDLIGISGIYSIPEIRQSERRTISAGQGSSLGNLGANVLQALLTGFHPNVYGLVAPRFSFLLVFQCHPVPKVRNRSTTASLLDALRSKRMLEPHLTIRDIAENEQKTLDQRQDTRLRHVTRWKREDITELIRWTVVRSNALYLSLIDPNLFVQTDGTIDFIKQRQFYLTIDRIVAETITVNTEEDTYVRKQIFFDVLDKYATLSAKKVGLQERQKHTCDY